MLLYLRDRLILGLIRCTYELGPFFHGHSFIEDVADYPGTLLKHEAPGTNRSFSLAADDDLVGLYVATDGAILANDEMTATDVADDLTIDLELTLSLQVPLHVQSCIDEGSRR